MQRAKRSITSNAQLNLFMKRYRKTVVAVTWQLARFPIKFIGRPLIDRKACWPKKWRLTKFFFSKTVRFVWNNSYVGACVLVIMAWWPNAKFYFSVNRKIWLRKMRFMFWIDRTHTVKNSQYYDGRIALALSTLMVLFRNKNYVTFQRIACKNTSHCRYIPK